MEKPTLLRKIEKDGRNDDFRLRMTRISSLLLSKERVLEKKMRQLGFPSCLYYSLFPFSLIFFINIQQKQQEEYYNIFLVFCLHFPCHPNMEKNTFPFQVFFFFSQHLGNQTQPYETCCTKLHKNKHTYMKYSLLKLI